jgi:hypothetical protein
MKLQTSIKPRRDGTVRAQGLDGVTYVFTPGEDGELTADVTDEATVAFLLRTQNFWPADPEDAERAMDLVKSNESDGEDGEDESEDEDDEPSVDALPVEANTPPAPKRARKAK